MELEGDDGSTIELKLDSSETVFGRGSGFNTKDRTVSRRHILFQLEKTENHIERRVSFQVIGRNALWVRSGSSGREIKVFRKLDRGEMAAGDWFCISGQSPVWFNLKRSETGERDLGSVNGSDGLGENSESIDLSQIDPVKEFGFLVIGHEFDCYPKQRIRDVNNWDWFINEPEEDSDDDGGSFVSNRKNTKGNRRRKRKKGGGRDEDDDDWSVESEEDKQTVAKIRMIERSKHSTRSKGKDKPHKDIEEKKDSLQRNTVSSNREDQEEGDDEDEDATLEGFIVNDADADEEQGGESDEEEEEFIDDDDEDELDD